MVVWARPLHRFTHLARTQGMRAAVGHAWHRVSADTALAVHEVRLSLAGKQLPSEQSILSHTAGAWDSLSDLVYQLRGKESRAWLFAAADRAHLIERWHAHYPDSLALTLQKADDFCQRRFDLLGTHYDFSAQDAIDWQWDATSRRRWPMQSSARIDRWLWAKHAYGDYRPIWELNRHQYFVTLGQAYWLTGDEQYAEACAEHLLSWIRANPFPFGLQWYSALEIGLRLIAWSLAFHYFRKSERFIELAGAAFMQSLYQQAQHLRTHLTLNWAGRNNHIIGEAAALTYIGALYDEFTAADEWCATGYRILQDEIARQTYPDGVNREQATAYHRFVLDFVLFLIVLARRGALDPAPVLEATAEKMLNYLMSVTTPAGDLPALGDDDNGRGISLSPRAAVQDTLAIGAVLFQRPDFKFVAGSFGENAWWLLGEDSWQVFEALPARAPQNTLAAFPHAGQYVLRSDWTAHGDYGMMRCGEFGLGGEGYSAHAHCDLLSPIIWIKGRPLLIDAGTYTYRGPWRDRLRLTAAHNTIMIDGRDQAAPMNAFGWQHVPIARGAALASTRVVGHLTTPDGVSLQRECELIRSGEWRIVDRITGAGSCGITWAFHFAPDLLLSRLADRAIQISTAQDPCWIVELLCPEVEFDASGGWMSPRYGQLCDNQVLRARWQGKVSPAGIDFEWHFAYAD